MRGPPSAGWGLATVRIVDGLGRSNDSGRNQEGTTGTIHLRVPVRVGVNPRFARPRARGRARYTAVPTFICRTDGTTVHAHVKRSRGRARARLRVCQRARKRALA
jgi:hypothetical protein